MYLVKGKIWKGDNPSVFLRIIQVKNSTTELLVKYFPSGSRLAREMDKYWKGQVESPVLMISLYPGLRKLEKNKITL